MADTFGDMEKTAYNADVQMGISEPGLKVDFDRLDDAMAQLQRAAFEIEGLALKYQKSVDDLTETSIRLQNLTTFLMKFKKAA